MKISPRENELFPKKLKADPRGQNPLPSVDYKQHSNILIFPRRKLDAPNKSTIPIQRPTSIIDPRGTVAVPKPATQNPQPSPMSWIAPLVVQGFIALACFVGVYFLNAINAGVSEVRSEMNSNASELRGSLSKLADKVETNHHELVGAINSVSEKEGVTNAKLEMLIGVLRPDHKP
ncbi:hypothetical protein [Hyphomicrobium sp. MC8b]|uniref:hypothetical protein n=1 Tax=Hyphomicrobium sp. MC8b TaxID=300273 RepID=UPI00391D4218